MKSIPESTKKWARKHIGCGSEGNSGIAAHPLFIVDFDAESIDCNVSHPDLIALIEQGVAPTCKFLINGDVPWFAPYNDCWSLHIDDNNTYYEFYYVAVGYTATVRVHLNGTIEVGVENQGK